MTRRRFVALLMVVKFLFQHIFNMPRNKGICSICIFISLRFRRRNFRKLDDLRQSWKRLGVNVKNELAENCDASYLRDFLHLFSPPISPLYR